MFAYVVNIFFRMRRIAGNTTQGWRENRGHLAAQKTCQVDVEKKPPVVRVNDSKEGFDTALPDKWEDPIRSEHVIQTLSTSNIGGRFVGHIVEEPMGVSEFASGC
jgi:hypothetical protein